MTGLRLMTAVVFLLVTLCGAVSSSLAQIEEEATADEIKEAQETAQRFVVRMQQTRDVGLLTNEFFLHGFISHFISEDGISPTLYKRLSQDERKRLFVATSNMQYLSAITIMGEFDDMKVVYPEKTLKPRLLLPRATLSKLRDALKLRDGDIELKSYRQFRAFLPGFENAVAEASAYLRRRGYEQTAAFQKELTSGDDLGDGINL